MMGDSSGWSDKVMAEAQRVIQQSYAVPKPTVSRIGIQKESKEQAQRAKLDLPWYKRCVARVKQVWDKEYDNVFLSAIQMCLHMIFIFALYLFYLC